MKIAIMGYGNLGKGVKLAIEKADDMELVGVFTRRDPATVTIPGVTVYGAEEIYQMKREIDAVIICGGSATDLPVQTPALAKHFTVVDSFDTHAKIPEHFAAVDTAAKEGGNIAMISVGWDPGMFSLTRLYSGAILPDGVDYTFWGPGVSQGHSDAIRRIDGVVDARQYTVPVEDALDAVRSGKQPDLSVRQKHRRVCYVVAAEGADKAGIEQQIVTMPNYFAPYDTEVHFITAEQMQKDHHNLPHGGCVIRSGKTGENNGHVIEYRLALDSNPEFTASVLVAYARAAVRLQQQGESGCKTVFDIPPALLSPLTGEQLRASLL